MNKDIHISKSLSWLLRHGAIKEGLQITPEGYIKVSEILNHKLFKGKISQTDIERIVANNDKQRFKLRLNPHSKTVEIKANQGHTIIEVADTELIPILQPIYNTVIHGTYLSCWPQIKNEGLSCMKRQHIHLAKGTLSDKTVISGLRRNAQILIHIDLEKALNNGLKFYESENGVILTAGNDKGYLEPKYFTKVVKVSTGFQPYTQSQDLIRAFSKFGKVKIEKLNMRLGVLSFPTKQESQAAIKASQKVAIYGEFLTVKPHTSSNEEESIKPRLAKKDFARSLQKGSVIEPKQIDLSGDFHQQLDSILAAVRLTQEEVTALSALYTDVELSLQGQWPGCTAIPFGSITTGLGIKSSDADCFVSIPAPLRQPGANFVSKAKRVLLQFPQTFTEILAIPRANTPIVKFFHIPTKTNCDLTFKTPLGAQNSKLIAFLLNSDPRLLPMAVAIKYWAKVHELSGTGKLTNYALTLLIIFYLQQAPISILPSVQWLQRDPANDVIVDSWNTGFMACRELLPPSSNTSSISELLGGFFEYYSTFNFEEMVICPFLGVPIKKAGFSTPNQLPEELVKYKTNVGNNTVSPLRYLTPFCIQDPFEQSHNVASPITYNLASDIKSYLKFAASSYEKEKLNQCDGFFYNILLLKPKIIRTKSHPEYRVLLFPRMILAIKNPDWKSVVRDIVLTIFQKLLKIKLTKLDEPANPEEKTNQNNKVNQEKKREKEKYSGTITKAIWKRKQFNKLYSVMNLTFEEKQERITEEVINVEKQLANMQFYLHLSFCADPASSVVLLKFHAGNLEMFREFGKFILSVTQNWFMQLLTPHARQKRNVSAKTVADTNKTSDSTDSTAATEDIPDFTETAAYTKDILISPETVADTIEMLDHLAVNDDSDNDNDPPNASAQSDGLINDDATDSVAKSIDGASEPAAACAVPLVGDNLP